VALHGVQLHAADLGRRFGRWREGLGEPCGPVGCGGPIRVVVPIVIRASGHIR
jgi:hypothetical protein